MSRYGSRDGKAGNHINRGDGNKAIQIKEKNFRLNILSKHGN